MAQSQSVSMPVRLPLLVNLDSRDSSTSKDSKLINCYTELKSEREVHIYRRPGMLQWGVPPATNAAGMGTFYWNGSVYSIFAGILYKDLAQVATGLDTSGGVYTFSSIVGSTPKLVMQNGKEGYAYEDTGGLTATLHSINASYPADTVKGLVYLNGATYVMQHIFGTQVTPAVIWGSKINSVSVVGDWSSLNFITAQIESDPGVALVKQLIYAVALKEWSTEIFFDSGKATGSPLQAMENAKLTYGCASADSIQSIEEVLFWLSTNRSASNQVIMLDKLQLKVISTPDIDRLLNQSDLTNIYSWQVKSNGHSFYILTLKNINLTLAYDIEQNRWQQWTDTNGNYVPIVSSSRDNLGNHILQHETNGTLYYMSSKYMDDNGLLMPISVITPVWDAGTIRRKLVNALYFDMDRVPGGIMEVSFSDDDYLTWSQPRLVNMGYNYPSLPHCGTFHRRAFKFNIYNQLPFRLKSIDLSVDIGTL